MHVIWEFIPKKGFATLAFGENYTPMCSYCVVLGLRSLKAFFPVLIIIQNVVAILSVL